MPCLPCSRKREMAVSNSKDGSSIDSHRKWALISSMRDLVFAFDICKASCIDASKILRTSLIYVNTSHQIPHSTDGYTPSLITQDFKTVFSLFISLCVLAAFVTSVSYTTFVWAVAPLQTSEVNQVHNEVFKLLPPGMSLIPEELPIPKMLCCSRPRGPYVL